MLADMKFLARIKEREIRILMVGAELLQFSLSTKRADGAGAFFLTLFSEAKYAYAKL